MIITAKTAYGEQTWGKIVFGGAVALVDQELFSRSFAVRGALICTFVGVEGPGPTAWQLT